MNRITAALAVCTLFGLGTGNALASVIDEDGDSYPVRADLTIDYFPSTVPPDPVFQGSQLGGIAQFYKYSLTGSTSFVPLVPPDPIDIGRVAAGGQFSVTFIPTDPCFMARTCGLGFSFSGLAGNFMAEAFSPNIGQSSIIPIGGLPSSASGLIFATDANFGVHSVGTWKTVLREISVPEPNVVELLISVLVFSPFVPWLRKREWLRENVS